MPGLQVLDEHRGAERQREQAGEPGEQAEEVHRALVAGQADDLVEDAPAVAVGAQLGLAALGAVLEVHRHRGRRDPQRERVHGQLGLDLELAGDGREALHEAAREDPVAAEHVAHAVAEDAGDDPVEHLVADGVVGAVRRAVGQALDLAADTDDVVEVLVDQLLDHRGRGGGVVGVVAVDQQVDVGVDVGEGASYDVALALERLGADDGAGAQRALDRSGRCCSCRRRRPSCPGRRRAGRRRPWRPRPPRCGTARSRRCGTAKPGTSA